MSVKIQDWNKVASTVVLVAQGPDGKPALLAENRPAYDYRSFTWAGTNCTQIVYKQGGASGTTVLTENFTYDGNGNVLTQTLTYP
ncbi:MAG: hypothetical protein EBR82_11625 [Caulobacteraceae bacterium]|nr:hypothetical protein [Caulobacteraceae bacterium]